MYFFVVTSTHFLTLLDGIFAGLAPILFPRVPNGGGPVSIVAFGNVTGPMDIGHSDLVYDNQWMNGFAKTNKQHSTI